MCYAYSALLQVQDQGQASCLQDCPAVGSVILQYLGRTEHEVLKLSFGCCSAVVQTTCGLKMEIL